MNEQQLFLEALQREDVEQQQAFLNQACGGDAALRQRVEVLLSAHMRAGSFLNGPIAAPTIELPSSERLGTRIGSYKLLQVIGEGGMGVVYMAEQKEPFERRVALKIIKPGMDSRQVIARFEAERQALAMMDHQNIARVFEAGTTESGHPYFVMELVKGVPITKYCDEKHLSLNQRLELMIPVCQAIQHAHQKGIIHRDIKPTNVHVAQYDGRPVPKVIDFGIAKATAHNLTERTMFTELGQLVGTLEYMSPEQAELNQLDVDTRSDIYSLGVLLYELLTGSTPFDKHKLRTAAFAEMLRIIREDDPPKPSTNLSTSDTLPSIAANRQTEPTRLSKTVRGELDWIVMKALDKDRSRRYETANAFAADIQRYLDDEAVLACPPSAGYRFGKFAGKHRAMLTTATLITVCLILGTTVSVWQAARATQAEARANANAIQAQANSQETKEKAQEAIVQAQEASTQRNEAQQQRDEAQKQRDEVRTVGEKLRATQSELRGTLYAAHMNLAVNAWQARGPQRVMDLLNQHRPQPGEADLRGFEWHYLNRLCHQEILTLKGHTSRVTTAVFSSDGTRLASTSYDKTIRIWDAMTGRQLRSVDIGSSASSVSFSPDGKRFATTPWDNAADASRVAAFDVLSGREILPVTGHRGEEFMVVAYSPDGQRLVTGSGTWDEAQKTYASGDVKVWDALSGQDLLTLKGHTGAVYAVAYSPDGRQIASGDSSSSIKLWNAQTGDELRTINDVTSGSGARKLTFSPDGKRLATHANEVKIWDVQTGQELLKIKDAHDVAFSPDGNRMCGAAPNKEVKVWDSHSGAEILSLLGHDASVHFAIFSPDGKRLASGSDDHTIKIWDAHTPQNPSMLPLGASVRTVAYSADGTRLVSATGSWKNSEQAYLTSVVKVWDAQTLRELITFNKHAGAVSNVAFTADGLRVACAPDDQTVKVWDLQNNQELVTCTGHTERVMTVAFSPDGKRLAGASVNGVVKVWDVETANELYTVKGGPGALAYSPDGSRLANCLVVASRTRAPMPSQVKIWDAHSGQELHSLEFAGQCLAFSPDGQRLASGTRLPNVIGPPGIGQVIKVWDVQSGRELFTCKGHTDGVTSLAFSLDGTRLASASYDKTIKVWDASTGQELLTLEGYSGYIGGDHAVAFSPDGIWLAAGADGGTVKTFNATPLPEKP